MKPIQTLYTALRILPLFVLSGCSTLQLVNSVSRFYAADIEKDIQFSPGNPNLAYDLYLPPAAPSSKAPTPVIVFFYGGSWNRGNKDEYEFVGRRLAAMGYITAIPNYRLYPEVSYPDFLRDGAQSIAHLKDTLRQTRYRKLKPDDRFIVMGHSAGAYNAAMISLDDRWLGEQGLTPSQQLRGFIGVAGAYNIYPINDMEVRPVFHHPNYPPKSQPIDHVQANSLPSLILAPESDNLVSIEINSVALNKALQKAGSPSELVTVKGTDHITIIGTLSPVLFFKGSSTAPIQHFVDAVTGSIPQQVTGTHTTNPAHHAGSQP